MLKNIHLKVSALILFVLFLGCKKYPENEMINLRTAKQRLCNKGWYLNKYTINGDDHTQDEVTVTWGGLGSMASATCIRKNTGFGFETSKDTYDNNMYAFKAKFNCEEGWFGDRWIFSKKKSHINLQTNFFPKMASYDWMIVKLTDKELIIENTDLNNRKYRAELSHTKN